MKARWLEVVGHLLFWGLTAALIISGFSVESREIEVINGIETIRVVHNEGMVRALILCLAISAVVAYGNIRHLEGLKVRSSRVKHAFSSFLIFCAGVLAYILVRRCSPERELPLAPGVAFGILGFYFSMSVAYGIGRVWLDTARQSQQFLLEKKQAELNLLRNQLQPHFLFNALNNLLSLVDQEQSPLLAKSIDRLSSLLRHVVYETPSGKVTVAQEFSFLHNYAELQLLRFALHEVTFDFNITGSFVDQEIEPGIFIPFIENAFKYGAEPEEHTRIHVHVDVTDPDTVQFSIKNQIRPNLVSQPGSGQGISSTQSRLALTYPDKHTLLISESDYFEVSLTLRTA